MEGGAKKFGPIKRGGRQISLDSTRGGGHRRSGPIISSHSAILIMKFQHFMRFARFS